jgi:hypothetical protein
MRYMQLPTADRDALMASLLAMTDHLCDRLGALDADAACRPGPDASFSAVEQVWHLADLERDGFGTRISRLLTEPAPHLADFDGTRIAAERNYRALSLADGLAAFAAARAANVARLRALSDDAWTRAGTQEGVGPISVCDLPTFMSQHDAAHRAEIAALLG